MEPFEIMVSESQERMLCVVEPARVDEVLALCEKWEVHGTAIGDGHRHRATSSSRDGDRVVGDMPVVALVDDCPLYDLAPAKPSAPLYPAPAARRSTPTRRRATIAARAARARRTSPRACRSSSSTTGSCSRARSAGPSRPTPPCCGCRAGGAIATSIDGNGPQVAADPYWGTVGVVLECASNLACVGAEPLGTTNNLNFGNPEKPHIAWQLTEAVRGIGDACRALDAPIVGGNVSLYNEGAGGPDLPDAGHRHGRRAARPGARRPARLRARGRRVGPGGLERDAVARRRPSWPSCAASRCPTGCPRSTSTHCAPVLARDPRGGARRRRCRSCHDVAEGGFLVAVAEACLAGGLGATLQIEPRPRRLDDGDPLRRGCRAASSSRARARRSSASASRSRSTSSARSAATRSSLDRGAGLALVARRAARGARRARPLFP